ncbi:Fc.00g098380.m01.CDS01 [Cosmosporella sp. VM-42]
MDYDDAFWDPLEGTSDHGAAPDIELEQSPELVVTDIGMLMEEDTMDVLSEKDRQVEDEKKLDAGGQDEDIREADIQEKTDQEENPAIDDGTNFKTLIPQNRIEVAIPEMSLEQRSEYDSIRSEIIQCVKREFPAKRGKISYNVEFTEGREELSIKVTFTELIAFENGKLALYQFRQGLGPPGDDMDSLSLKRKRGDEDEWDSGTDSVKSDRMEIDDEDELQGQPPRARCGSSHLGRLRRSREATRQPSQNHTIPSDDDDLDEFKEIAPSGRTRVLRTRQPQQTTFTGGFFKNGSANEDQDELQNDTQTIFTDDDDEDFAVVTSDIVSKKGRPKKSRQKRLRRLRAASSRAQTQAVSRLRSPDSDIEFEAPRRSARSTRNKVNMQDDALMDEDSFYIVDDKGPGTPKVMSVREVFQPPPADSAFASMHMHTCHTCGSSKTRGQMVQCQGCTLSYHKNCLGFRSGREHMVTKVGEDDFVLQCRFCIGIYNKKDSNAPKQGMCQGCRGEGRACAAFSEKKTARQEEKLREQNDGLDPITPVPVELLNNADIVLFRCATCHRGWHTEHLPSSGTESINTDLKSERLKDYSIDWQCNDCSAAEHKIHRLVAWRPLDKIATEQTHRPAYSDVSEDNKEYLVKWDSISYAHCAWVAGAWVFGVAASTMRTSFGKRDAEQDLLKLTKKDAIPDEFLMADVILNVKMNNSVSRNRTKEYELANISRVSKVFVKFQGLGYDDVVWDSPPSQDTGEVYTAFAEAYYEYVEGKYFQSEPQHKIRERIKAFKAAPFTEVEHQPEGLKRGKLMGYQLEGLNWLLENYHSNRSIVLADEMGLGKTVQVVSLVTSLVQDKPKVWPFLIVVPNSTCPNWRREFKQWAPDLRVVTYHGGREPQELAYKYELFPDNSADMKAHVVIMSYDSAQDPRTRVLFNPINWAGLIVDEGQRLKNDQNLLYLALRSMNVPFRLLLTGTPLQNNKRELFNLIQFIDKTQDAMKLDEEYMVLDKQTLPKLHEKIRPYFLRRTKAGVLKFLPPMAQIILPVSMTVIQEKLSKSIMAKNPELIKSMFANSKMNKKERGSLNNILMQLRKCLCHPFVYSEAIEERHHDPTILYRNLVEASAKLILLKIMLPKLQERGHRVLIFSQFLQQLDIIEDFLAGLGFEYRRLDGQIGSLEKQRRIDAFNAPDSTVFAFLLSTRAGGVGINLATADTVIIMDPDFNPHQDIQALSRAHRIGQKKKVLCFQLMTKDSVEERIMQVGRKKMALDHALIESMDDDDLAGDDLESILKHGAQALFSDDYQKDAIRYDDASVDKLLDRTQMEQTKTSEEGSAETQFSYARVWANDKAGFEDGIATGEKNAPMPINSSVWDRILAQREEEARREAEANREVLGRGNRRRQAINYKTNAIENAQMGDIGPESSDSSDDFAGADSGDDSDEEDQNAITKGKRRKPSPNQQQTPAASPKKSALKNTAVDKRSTQTPKKNLPRSTKSPTPKTPKRGKPQKQTKQPLKPTPKPKKTTEGPTKKKEQLPSPAKGSQKAKPSKPTDGKGNKSIKSAANPETGQLPTPKASSPATANPSRTPSKTRTKPPEHSRQLNPLASTLQEPNTNLTTTTVDQTSRDT